MINHACASFLGQINTFVPIRHSILWLSRDENNVSCNAFLPISRNDRIGRFFPKLLRTGKGLNLKLELCESLSQKPEVEKAFAVVASRCVYALPSSCMIIAANLCMHYPDSGSFGSLADDGIKTKKRPALFGKFAFNGLSNRVMPDIEVKYSLSGSPSQNTSIKSSISQKLSCL